MEYVFGVLGSLTATILAAVAVWLWRRSRLRIREPEDEISPSGPTRTGIRAVDSSVRIRHMKARNQNIAIEIDRTVLDAEDLDIE